MVEQGQEVRCSEVEGAADLAEVHVVALPPGVLHGEDHLARRVHPRGAAHITQPLYPRRLARAGR
eukprot:13372-Eustigmatos_ZCMA.PRE.1